MIFPYKLIDLTHTLDETICTWDAHCGFNQELCIDYSDCQGEYKFRVMKLKMNASIGTHMDAPSHCIPAGRCIDNFEINQLCMPCVVIDISDKCHERYSLSNQDIADFQRKYGIIDKGSCVMIKTGWEKFWSNPSKYHNNHIFPSVSPEAAGLLLEMDIQALGIDTLSADRPQDGYNVHRTFLGNDKILIENVANLDSMPPINSFVMILPIKINGGTEAPIRLIGLINEHV